MILFLAFAQVKLAEFQGSQKSPLQEGNEWYLGSIRETLLWYYKLIVEAYCKSCHFCYFLLKHNAVLFISVLPRIYILLFNFIDDILHMR